MELEPIEKVVAAYGRYVTCGFREEEGLESEARLTLLTRNLIQDRWAELTPGLREYVRSIDGLLVEKHVLVAEVLPRPGMEDRRRWWWFLHEGPQVREQAERAA